MASKENQVKEQAHNMRYDLKKNKKNKKPYYKPKDTNLKKKMGSCFVCGKLSHYAAQCRKRAKGDNSQRVGNSPKPNMNLVEGDDNSDKEIIVGVVS
ncbi:hypothetical protein K1719_016290 [Acacia pycnantha]|nr:hypothetical protein K1719_016290 [Acacia pycnantha]